MDDRPTARRAVTGGLFLLNVSFTLRMPYVFTLVGALGFLTKLVLDELVVGCCNNHCHSRLDTELSKITALERQDEGGGNGLEKAPPPRSACSVSGYRPRLSDTICLCFLGMLGLQYGWRYIVDFGHCHAAAAATAGDVSAVRNTTTNIAACDVPTGYAYR
jgi:hypothetical protein